MSFIEKHVLKNFVIFYISLNGYHFRGNSSIKNSLEDDAPSCIWKSEYSQRKIFWDIEKKIMSFFTYLWKHFETVSSTLPLVRHNFYSCSTVFY